MIALLSACLAALLLQDAPPTPPPADALHLTLNEAIDRGMRNNLTIRQVRLDAEQTVDTYGQAWGAFDTIFFLDGTASRSVAAPTPTNIVGGVNVGGAASTETVFVDIKTGFRGTFLTGTSWSFDVGPRRVKTFSDAGESDVYVGDWTLSVSHPLLRGGDNFARSALTLARQDVEISAAASFASILLTLETIIDAYWNLVFTNEVVATRMGAVVLAQELVATTTAKEAQGLQTQLEVFEVKAELAQRKEEELTAKNAALDAIDLLRRLILAPDVDDELWDLPITVAKDAVATAPAPETKLQVAVDTALARHPDVVAARTRLQRADVILERAENLALPKLDLTGAYGINSNEDDYRDSLTNLNDEEFDTVSLVLGLEIPFGNRTAGYAVRRAQSERREAGVALRDTEIAVITRVRTAVREVELQELRVGVTEEAMRLNEQLYDGERRRLENDLSTPFQVRETLQNYLTATDTHTRAKFDLEIGRARLLSAQGVLLEYFGYARELPPDLDESVRPPAP